MSHNLFLLGCQVIIFYAQKKTSVNALNDNIITCLLWWRAPNNGVVQHTCVVQYTPPPPFPYQIQL